MAAISAKELFVWPLRLETSRMTMQFPGPDCY